MSTLPDSQLTNFLFGKTKRGLLALFYGHPDESYYVNQILRSLNNGSGAVQRELNLMLEAGLIIRERSGNQVYYRANKKIPFFEELRGIVIKTFGVADVIRESLSGLIDKIEVAFIFGSVATRTETRASDIDLMVIGKVDFEEVLSAVSSAQDALKREINPVIYPVMEFQQKAKTDHHFIRSVLESEKIFLIGDAGELSQLSRRR